MPQVVEESLRDAHLSVADLDWLLLHQANQRILDSAAERLKMPPERVITNLAKYGNTSAASIPLALDEAVREGHVTSGQTVTPSRSMHASTCSSAIPAAGLVQAHVSRVLDARAGSIMHYIWAAAVQPSASLTAVAFLQSSKPGWHTAHMDHGRVSLRALGLAGCHGWLRSRTDLGISNCPMAVIYSRGLHVTRLQALKPIWLCMSWC